jgi:hypothetical protein
MATALAILAQRNNPNQKEETIMTSTITFETINIDQLATVAGGFDWGELARSTGGGALAGGLGGAAVGAIAGPGVLVGAGAGAAGGAVTAGVNNIGQQLGWWK